MRIDNASGKFNEILSEIKALAETGVTQMVKSPSSKGDYDAVKTPSSKGDCEAVRTPSTKGGHGREKAFHSKRGNEIINHLRYKEYSDRVPCSFYLDKHLISKLDYIAKAITSDLREVGLYRTKKDITRSQVIEMLIESISTIFDEDTEIDASNQSKSEDMLW